MSERRESGMLDNVVNEIEVRVDRAADAAKGLGASAEASASDITAAVENVVGTGVGLAGDTWDDAVEFARARIKEGLEILKNLKGVATG